jgi:hypothetical protein
MAFPRLWWSVVVYDGTIVYSFLNSSLPRAKTAKRWSRRKDGGDLKCIVCIAPYKVARLPTNISEEIQTKKSDSTVMALLDAMLP